MAKTPSEALPHDGNGARTQSVGNTTGTYRYQVNRHVLSVLLDHIAAFPQRVADSEQLRVHVQRQATIALAAGAPASEFDYLTNQFKAESMRFIDVVWDSLLRDIRSRLTSDVVTALISSTRGGIES